MLVCSLTRSFSIIPVTGTELGALSDDIAFASRPRHLFREVREVVGEAIVTM